MKDYSCPDITQETCYNPNVPHPYDSFSQYINLLITGWPASKAPSFITENIAAFQDFCQAFVQVKGVRECNYNENTRVCTRVGDGSKSSIDAFKPYFYVSLSFWTFRLFMEILMVLISLWLNRVPQRFRALIVDSPIFFLLQFKGIYQQVLEHVNTPGDLWRKFVFAFLFEGAQQFCLQIYFVLYVNDTVRTFFYFF